MKILIMIMGFVCSVSAMNFGADVAQAATPNAPQLTEISQANGSAEVVLPVNSSSILDQSWPAMLGDSRQQLKDLYSTSCKSLAYAAMSSSMELPVRNSEINELNRPISAMNSSLFTSAKCEAPTFATNASGFSQAKGSVRFIVRKPALPESSDRRLFQITMPWVKSAGWGPGISELVSYRKSCSIDKSHAGSTLIAACSEPEMTIACCGNAALTGEMNALVYAYANPKLDSIVNTGKTTLEVEAQNAAVLVQKSQLLGADLAFSICTPANFEYAPVMAFQSTCYFVQQTYASLDPTLRRCHGTTSTGVKVWILEKQKTGSSEYFLHVATSSERSSSSAEASVKRSTSSSGEKLETILGATLEIPADKSASATLVGGGTILRDITDSSVSMVCN